MTDGSVSREEIERYEEKHGEPHPVFEVEHRPERTPVKRQAAPEDVERAREYPMLDSGATMGTVCEYREDDWTWVIITDLPEKTWGDIFDPEDERADEQVVRFLILDELTDTQFCRFEDCVGCREHVKQAREFSDHPGAGKYARRSDFAEKFRPLSPRHPDYRDAHQEQEASDGE